MPPWDAQEQEQLTANVMRFMLFRQAQRPDQPVRREDLRLAMGRHQSLGVAGLITTLAQAREPGSTSSSRMTRRQAVRAQKMQLAGHSVCLRRRHAWNEVRPCQRCLQP